MYYQFYTSSPIYAIKNLTWIGNNKQLAVWAIFYNIRNDEFKDIHITLDQIKTAFSFLLTCPSSDNNQLRVCCHIIVQTKGNNNQVNAFKRIPYLASKNLFPQLVFMKFYLCFVTSLLPCIHRLTPQMSPRLFQFSVLTEATQCGRRERQHLPCILVLVTL